MDMDIHEELYEGLDVASPERLACSRRAYERVPRLDRPTILDAGCGRGDVAIELARLSGGEIFGIDIDERPLRIFEERIREEGLEDRVHAIHGSILNMDFAPESFDIAWAEGSLHIVGLGKGLEALRPFLKPGGFLVIHEIVWTHTDPPADISRRWKERFPGLRSEDELFELARTHNYSRVDQMALPHDFWGSQYYEPLERRIGLLREKYSDNAGVLAILDREQSEVDLYRRSSRWLGTFFFILRRGDR